MGTEQLVLLFVAWNTLLQTAWFIWSLKTHYDVKHNEEKEIGYEL